MTTLVVRLTPALARAVASTADAVGLSHEELAVESLKATAKALAALVSQRRGGRWSSHE